MNKIELIEKCSFYGERKFEPSETLRELKSYPRFFKMGCSDFTQINYEVLFFEMRNNHFSGYVCIVFGWNNTFKIKFVDEVGEVVDEVDLIREKELFNVLEEKIKYIGVLEY